MLEMKTALAHLVRKYTFSRDRSQEVKTTYQVTMNINVHSGLPIYIHLREPQSH